MIHAFRTDVTLVAPVRPRRSAPGEGKVAVGYTAFTAATNFVRESFASPKRSVVFWL